MMQTLMEIVQPLEGPGRAGGSGGGAWTDLRGLGGPPVFDGKGDKYKEWVSKLSSYVASRCAKGIGWMARASCRTQAIDDHDVRLEYEAEANEITDFSARLQWLLYDSTQGEALERASEAGVGNGFGSVRRIKRRFKPRTAGPKRAVVQQTICSRPAAKLDEFGRRCASLRAFPVATRGCLGRPSKRISRSPCWLTSVPWRSWSSRIGASTTAVPRRRSGMTLVANARRPIPM